MTHGRADVEALLDTWSLRPSRALGQNFVADANTVRRIVRLAGVGPADPVVEVGAGLGSLTLALVEAGAAVTAVEVDRHLIPVLRSELADRAVRIVEADALRLDWGALLAGDGGDPGNERRAGGSGGGGGRPWSLVANLPYNVATPLVLRILETQPTITRLLVMVQREVGERLAASAGDEAYGAVSLRVQYFADATVVGRVSPNVFVPRPKVESALVSVVRRETVRVDPSVVSETELFSVIRTAFGQRRKMLRRSLADWTTDGVFERAHVEETRRPEELTLEEFARLAASR